MATPKTRHSTMKIETRVHVTRNRAFHRREATIECLVRVVRVTVSPLLAESIDRAFGARRSRTPVGCSRRHALGDGRALPHEETPVRAKRSAPRASRRRSGPTAPCSFLSYDVLGD